MQCTEVQPLFTDFADNTLSHEQLHALTDHLLACQTCALEWQEFQQTLSLMHSIETQPPPADLLHGIQAKLAKTGFFYRAWALIEPLNFSLSIPAAAAIFTLAMLGGFLLKTSPLERPNIFQTYPARLGALQQDGVLATRRPPITPNAMFAVSHSGGPQDGHLDSPPRRALAAHLSPDYNTHRLLSPDIHVLLEGVGHDDKIALYREMLRRNWQIRPITTNLFLVHLPQGDLANFHRLLKNHRFVLMPAAAAETQFGDDKNILTAALCFQ